MPRCSSPFYLGSVLADASTRCMHSYRARVSSPLPRFVLVHGVEDATVPCNASKEFARALRDCGAVRRACFVWVSWRRGPVCRVGLLR